MAGEDEKSPEQCDGVLKKNSGNPSSKISGNQSLLDINENK